MKESEFYGWALPQLINSNITVKFLNKPKHLNCGGWFAEDKKELVVCTKHEDAFSIFIHEFCHFLQFRDDPQAWSLCTGTDTFFAWLQGKDFSKEEVAEATHQAQALEHDCETKALKLIKQLNIDIDVGKYTQKANAYLFSYLITKKLRLWPNTKNSIYESEISEYFDPKLVSLEQLKYLKNIPRPAVTAWKAKCYNLDSVLKKV